MDILQNTLHQFAVHPAGAAVLGWLGAWIVQWIMSFPRHRHMDPQHAAAELATNSAAILGALVVVSGMLGAILGVLLLGALR